MLSMLMLSQWTSVKRSVAALDGTPAEERQGLPQGQARAHASVPWPHTHRVSAARNAPDPHTDTTLSTDRCGGLRPPGRHLTRALSRARAQCGEGGEEGSTQEGGQEQRGGGREQQQLRELLRLRLLR